MYTVPLTTSKLIELEIFSETAYYEIPHSIETLKFHDGPTNTQEFTQFTRLTFLSLNTIYPQPLPSSLKILFCWAQNYNLQNTNLRFLYAEKTQILPSTKYVFM